MQFFFPFPLQNQPIILGSRKYGCPFCERIMRDRHDMMKHIRTHTGEKPYNCPYCPHATAQNSSMKKHIRSHKKYF